jgi:DNA-binding NarL/FixJ family response regulator
MTTVLIADDQPLQRMGFRMLLDGTPGMTVVGEAVAGAEAARMAEGIRPDVVLMDAYLHDCSPHARADPLLATLSEREREVLDAIGQGATNTEIAQRFTLTESTVQSTLVSSPAARA